MEKNKIIPQMFDIRPVDEAGDLDWKKIQAVALEKDNFKKREFSARQDVFEEQLQLLKEKQEAERKMLIEKELEVIKKREEQLKKQAQEIQAREQQVRDEEERMQLVAEQQWHEKHAQQEELLRQQEIEKEKELQLEMAAQEKWRAEQQQAFLRRQMEAEAHWHKMQAQQEALKERISKKKRYLSGDWNHFSLRDLLEGAFNLWQFDLKKSAYSFAVASFLVIFGIGSVAFVSKGFGIKGKVLGVSEDGYGNLNAAMQNILDRNFEGSSFEFEKAYANFSQASSELDELGGILVDSTRFVPFASKLSSGKNVVEAGKHISAAGKNLNEVARVAAELKNPLGQNGQVDSSILKLFDQSEGSIRLALEELRQAQENINLVNIDDLPKDKQAKFLLLKEKLPLMISSFEVFTNNSYILTDLLGKNGPRKYLFLFQNNNEMRATGGFIGSYGLLDISQGKIRNFFIDGIFNPDGQLKDKIVPPKPIQKISAAWSLHDSNWFADFPTSAKEAIGFYEKTGGPTVDGVITLTPTVMEKLLRVTGPIEMPEYEVTLDADNFVEKTQYEVEVDYDKQENKPKKILADLAPIVLDRILNTKDVSTMIKALNALSEGLSQKHILLYSENADLQKIISDQGWSGEVLSADKDYLSVINTNINGFKTDGIVAENIKHEAKIQSDGSIVDTVTITRKHNGGNSDYEWWNKVNADYMRVFVPLGSQLLSVSGQTREINESPLDYAALGFKQDPLVQREEDSMIIDQQTGTRIYQDAGKTVFANWVYVSPQETAEISYTYKLPFNLFSVSTGDSKQVDSYALVAQKQSGSFGSGFVSNIIYPANYSVKWKYPEAAQQGTNGVHLDEKLEVDRFLGIVFEKAK